MYTSERHVGGCGGYVPPLISNPATRFSGMVILLSPPLYLRGRAAGTCCSTTRLGGPQGQLGVLVKTKIAFRAGIFSHYTVKAIPVPTKK